jgi:hypothetical protein
LCLCVITKCIQKSIFVKWVLYLIFFSLTNNQLFCLEATYAFGKQIDLIPCRLQESYKPDGWLGSIATTRLYIDFSPPNDFEKSFEELIKEIEYIKANPQSNRCKFYSF